MKERVHLKITDTQADFILRYKLRNNFEDRQDAIRDLINKEIKREKSFFYKLKNLF